MYSNTMCVDVLYEFLWVSNKYSQRIIDIYVLGKRIVMATKFIPSTAPFRIKASSPFLCFFRLWRWCRWCRWWWYLHIVVQYITKRKQNIMVKCIENRSNMKCEMYIYTMPAGRRQPPLQIYQFNIKLFYHHYCYHLHCIYTKCQTNLNQPKNNSTKNRRFLPVYTTHIYIVCILSTATAIHIYIYDP